MIYVQYPPRRTRMVMRRSAFAILSLGGFMAVHGAEAADASFSDFPFLVHCELNYIDRAYYLSKVDSDGAAVYITPENQAGTITISGTAKPIGGEWAGSCSGKTLEQLRSAGQTFYLRLQ